MKLRGREIASSVRKWAMDDIQKSPASKHELGKFLTGVATSTLGLFITLLKFGVESPSMDKITISCFMALVLSTLVAIYMAIPYVVKINNTTELYSEYNRIVITTIYLMTAWLFFWLAGVSLGVIRLFANA